MNIKSKNNNISNLSKSRQTETVQQRMQRMDKKLRDAAKMYEQQFLQEMLKAMRSTVSYSEMNKPTMAENIYKEQLYNQYAEKWVETGGNGLADTIYKEIKEKLIPSQTSRYINQSPSKKPVK